MYRPLAAVLAVLLAPSFSWLESMPDTSSGTFQSSGQVIVHGCSTPRGNAIIQNICVNGASYEADLNQLESDAIGVYIAEHSLPASDASLIYSEGRTDLRNAIRAAMLTILLGIITKSPTSRSPHEQTLYAWLQAVVQQNEIAEYASALAEYKKYQNDPCNFKLDAVIAREYGLSYDGTGQCNTLFSGAPVPAASYFTTVGLENSYGKPSQTTPNFAALVAETQINVGEIVGIAAGAGVALAAAAGVGIAVFLPVVFPFLLGSFGYIQGSGLVLAVGDLATVFTTGAGGAFGTASIALGPAAIVLIFVAIGVTAGIQVFNNQQQLDQLNDLSNLLSQAQNSLPDLGQFAADTTGLGLLKLNESLVAETLPDVASTAALPPHGAGDPAFVVTPKGGAPSRQSSFNYTDWNDVSWQAQTAGGWFDLSCLGNSSGQDCPQANSFIASIQIVDWSGTKRFASRIGQTFVLTKTALSTTDKPCPADPISGVTPVTNFTQCSSYVAAQIEYTYQGAQYSASLEQAEVAPQFTSTNTIFFTYQPAAQHVDVAASGTPAPVISLAASSSLPGGVIFSGSNSVGNGKATFTFSTFAAATPGEYQVTLLAQSGNKTTSRIFTIVITTQLRITSASILSTAYGQPVNFLVTTTGFPTPSLSIDPQLLSPGLTFHDNGNGTATISGSARASTSAICIISNGQQSCNASGITATNAAGSVSQQFSVSVAPAPKPLLTSSGATFLAGTLNTSVVRTTGATTPVSFVFDAEGLSWLSFRDNGDGTGVLSGTPPADAAGHHTFYLFPLAEGTNTSGLPVIDPHSPFGYDPSGFRPLDVIGESRFVTPNLATFTVGTPASFTIRTNQSNGFITEIGALPQALGLASPGDGTALIVGVAAAGTGGNYTLQLSFQQLFPFGQGTATQALNLQINEEPVFTSTTTANFYVGQNNTFAVDILGYPILSNAPVAQSATTPNYVPGAQFTVAGLPSDLTYGNLNPQGYATGTLTLSGQPSPADVGQHQVTISVSNGGPTVVQQLTVNILAVPGDVNGDGAATCADFSIVRSSFGQYRGQPGYKAEADLNNDGVVNIQDLSIVSRSVSKGTVCH